MVATASVVVLAVMQGNRTALPPQQAPGKPAPKVTLPKLGGGTAALPEGKVTVVDFWATWCGPCKMVAPVLDEIATEHADKITIAKMDVDQNPGTSRDYKIMSIPTMLLFSGGEVVKQIVGAKPKAALLQDLAEFI